MNIQFYIMRNKATAIVTLLCFILATATGLLYIWLLADLPPIHIIETRQMAGATQPTTQILDRNGRLLYEVIDPEAGKQIDLRLESIPPTCIQATLATEDSRFYEHTGIDPLAILRASWQNIQGRAIVSGGSTITQQLARNLLLDLDERFERTLRRKLREAWLSWRLEHHYTKNELLTLYLNQIYYGHFAFGIEAAAQSYFAKPAAQLSQGECTLLAGLIQYPSNYNPLHDPTQAKRRQQTVLGLMEEAGHLSAYERTLIAADPLRYKSSLFQIQAPHFVMMIQHQLVQQLGVDRVRTGGLQVTTTLDLNLQQQAEEIVHRQLDRLNCRQPSRCDLSANPARRIDNGAAVILDSQTGEILALVGNSDYFNPQIQGNVNAALAHRQPGSAIKPFTYAAALDPKWHPDQDQPHLTPATIIADLPTTFQITERDGTIVPYQPGNYDSSFHGPVSVRAALANSYNIPAVKVLKQIGVETLQQIATQAGITTFLGDFDLALTLGGREVSLLELTTAYGILDDGLPLESQTILEIVEIDHEQKNAEKIDKGYISADPRPILSPEAAYLVTDILADPIARIPEFSENSVLELPFAAAVKTGTTTDWRDNWTVGYSTERFVGVWVGNADNTPMLDVSGIDGAGPIWHDLMLAAHLDAGIKPASFPVPDRIVEVAICSPSGLLPTPNCPRIHRESFIAGTEPVTMDDQFQRIAIDRTTGARANINTPSDQIQEQVYWMLGPEYRAWMMEQGMAIAPPEHLPVNRNEAVSSTNDQVLVLSNPAANTVYALHPSVPRARQRVQVTGYAANDRTWAMLRLIKDGVILAEAQDTTHINAWWAFELGRHTFWLEGRMTREGEVVLSQSAAIVVEAFALESSP